MVPYGGHDWCTQGILWRNLATWSEWDVDIQMNPKESCWESMSWIDVTQGRDK